MYDNRFFHDHQAKTPILEGTRPTALKPPVYPLIAALTFLLFGFRNFFALFFLHAFLSALTCLLMFLSLKKYSYNIAAIAGFSLALYPPFVYHSVTVTENTTLLLFLIALFLLCFIKIQENNSLKYWTLTGITGGILALTEVVAIPFILVSLFYITFFTNSPRLKRTKKAAISVLIIISLMLPWLVRNYITFHRFGIFKSGSGQSMLHGLYETGTGILIPEETLLRLELNGRGKNEVEEDNAINEILIPLLYKNLGYLIRVHIPRNFVYFWWETKTHKHDKSLKYLLGRKLPYLVLLIFALPSMVWWSFRMISKPTTTLRENVRENLGIILLVLFTIPYCIYAATLLRYHFPIQLVMFSFFAETLNYSHSKISLFAKSLARPI
ncbi:MAG: glycosyltransferase family 39 protein [Candidatus Hodarchaeota archaeon]